MNSEDFRRIALGMEGAIEGSHMGHPDFRVNGRIFATIHHDHQWAMVKLTPEQQEAFVRKKPATFAPESGAWGRAGCTKVCLASADEETLNPAMTLAWQNTFAKRAVRRKKPD
ncbi:MAG TPA: MmcQ/YjbR family DNA-binding protein [Acidobacteriota bacterium]|nr:MmcQ/YjbR family DNA-binding protein [Acidobacteriota bacterium]